MSDLDWVTTIALMSANADPGSRHILTTAMNRHPDAPWLVVIKEMVNRGYNLLWALPLFGQ